MTKTKTGVSKWPVILSMMCIMGFITLIITLHLIQTRYDPVGQLMSELALGEAGTLMLPAFTLLALAIVLTQFTLRDYQTGYVVQGLFALAAIGFLLSGLFPLGSHSLEHISAISMAFVTFVLGMLAFPTHSGKATRLLSKSMCQICAAGVAISVASGHNLLPMGIAQRLAAVCLLGWLLWLDWRLLNHYRPPL